MSTTTEVDEEEWLEPDVDGDLVQEMQEYSLRKDDKYVEGTIVGIRKTRGSRIALDIELPTDSFTEVFEKPSPDNKRFEQFAEHYGTGLVDVSDLKGQRVWCGNEDGSWEAMVREKESRLGRVKELCPDDGVISWVTVLALAPLISLGIIHQANQAEKWTFKDHPGHDTLNEAGGVLVGFASFLFWVAIVLIILILI